MAARDLCRGLTPGHGRSGHRTWPKRPGPGGAAGVSAASAGLRRAAAADLRRLLAERGVGERLERLVEGGELAREAQEVLVVLEPLVRLRELVRNPVEPLQDQVEAAVREIVLHALIVVRRAAGASARRRRRGPAPPAPRPACPRPRPGGRRRRGRGRARRARAARPRRPRSAPRPPPAAAAARSSRRAA